MWPGAILFAAVGLVASEQWSPTFKELAVNGSKMMDAIEGPLCQAQQRSTTIEAIQAQGWRLRNYTTTWDAKYRHVTAATDFLVVLAELDDDNDYKFEVNFTEGFVGVDQIWRNRRDQYSWSEVLFTLYKHFAPTYSTSVPDIKTFCYDEIINPQFLKVAEEINTVAGGKLKTQGYLDLAHRSMEWNAVMGSQIGKGQAYFLFQHRVDLPILGVGSIEIGHQLLEDDDSEKYDSWNATLRLAPLPIGS